MYKENAYFEELARQDKEYWEVKNALEEKKEKVRKEQGWESEELKALYDQAAALEYPVPAGACKAFRAYENMLRRGEDEMEMADFLWDKDIEDFVTALREAGFDGFIYTNHSTACMENLHGFAAAGCKMIGLTKLCRTERRFGGEQVEEILGVRFEL